MTHQERALEAIRYAIAFKTRSISFVRLDIDRIPDEASTMIDLRELNVNGCKITALPVWLRHCKGLKSLVFRDTKITYLPEWLSELDSLEYLDIGRNEISELPVAFGRLKRLKHLCISENKFTSFPEQIPNIVNLNILGVGGARIDRLPDSICKLKKLAELEINSMGLKTLPGGLLEMKNLKLLWVSGNPDLGLPQEMADERSGGIPAKKVLKYYFTHIAPLPKGARGAKTISGLAAPDPFEKIRDAKTSSDDHSTEQIIFRLKKWRRDCAFTVATADEATIELRFESLPENLDAFAREINKFCPDVIDQHFGCMGEAVQAARSRGEPIPEELRKLTNGLDLDDENSPFKMLKRSLLWGKKLTLWWD